VKGRKNMAITWASIEFTNPVKITQWDPPYRAAVYAIMRKKDPINKPNTYTLIYVGESGNLSDRGFYKSHHKYPCWTREAGVDENIYISVYLMPNSTEEERREIEGNIVKKIHPVCND